MSDWAYINKGRVRTGRFASNDSDGFNGCFCLWINSERVKIIASDGGGWQHVSVSLEDRPSRTPRWDIMCMVKDLFWDDEDVVAQFHPRMSEYINNHSGCLHLWKCIDGREFPTPPTYMIGIKELGVIK